MLKLEMLSDELNVEEDEFSIDTLVDVVVAVVDDELLLETILELETIETEDEFVGVFEELLLAEPATVACPSPFRARFMSERTSSLVRHWSSTQIFSLARKVPAKTSPMPFAASASHFVVLENRLLKKLAANDCEAEVVAVVVEAIFRRFRFSSCNAFVLMEIRAGKSMLLALPFSS